MKFRFKKWVALLIFLLPPSLAKNVCLRALGYKVGKNVRIYPTIVLGVRNAHFGSNVRIGPGNVFRDLEYLELGESARIGQWNWISAATPLVVAGAPGSLKLGQHSAITSRHYLDASGGISIGRYTTVAGVRSTFVTHGIDWRTAEQTYKGIKIGDYCLLSSNLNVPPGARVSDCIVVGMGATIPSRELESGHLLIQPRATAVAETTGEYFGRDSGYIRKIRSS